MANKKINSDFDLGLNKIKNAILNSDVLSVEGQIAYASTSGKIQYHDSTSIKNLASEDFVADYVATHASSSGSSGGGTTVIAGNGIALDGGTVGLGNITANLNITADPTLVQEIAWTIGVEGDNDVSQITIVNYSDTREVVLAAETSGRGCTLSVNNSNVFVNTYDPITNGGIITTFQAGNIMPADNKGLVSSDGNSTFTMLDNAIVGTSAPLLKSTNPIVILAGAFGTVYSAIEIAGSGIEVVANSTSGYGNFAVTPGNLELETNGLNYALNNTSGFSIALATGATVSQMPDPTMNTIDNYTIVYPATAPIINSVMSYQGSNWAWTSLSDLGGGGSVDLSAYIGAIHLTTADEDSFVYVNNEGIAIQDGSGCGVQSGSGNMSVLGYNNVTITSQNGSTLLNAPYGNVNISANNDANGIVVGVDSVAITTDNFSINNLVLPQAAPVSPLPGNIYFDAGASNKIMFYNGTGWETITSA